MSWNPHVEVQYRNTSYPYNSAGSFIEYFEGLTYEHVNFIFDGTSHVQESVYPLMDTSLYKFGLSESESTSYYNYGHPCEVNYHDPCSDDNRRPSENTVNNEQNAAVNTVRERNRDTTTRESVECPWRHHNTHDYQLVWQDSIDPGNMTYEELLELGETVGSQNRGLSQDLIALLPISKYKCGLFSWKKSRNERCCELQCGIRELETRALRAKCVICQMEYKRGDMRITLPCKHAYHAACGARWLSINKACPVCYTEVFDDLSKL